MSLRYGIQLVKNDGTVMFCTSSSCVHSFDEDISYIAMFASKESAAKSVRALRKSGAERINDGVLTIATLNIVVDTVIQVPHAQKKVGVIVSVPFDRKPPYYSGSMTGAVRQQYTDTIECATIFPNEAAARSRVQLLKEDAITDLRSAERVLASIEDELKLSMAIGRSDVFIQGIKHRVQFEKQLVEVRLATVDAFDNAVYSNT